MHLIKLLKFVIIFLWIFAHNYSIYNFGIAWILPFKQISDDCYLNYAYWMWWVFELHVDKRNLHILHAGTDAFKCIAQGESTDVWHENRAKFQE